MDEDETIEGLLALIGLSMFFLFASLGTILASMDNNSILYIEFSPKEDLIILSGFLLIDFIFLSLFLGKSLSFKRSTDLNRRQVELYLKSDKLMYYAILCSPVEGFLIYFLIKYFQTGLALYLFILVIFEIGIYALIFHNAYRIKRDYKEGLLE